MSSERAVSELAERGLPTVDQAGVDLTLVRAYLALTPIERLRSLQNAVRAIQKFTRRDEVR